MAETYGLRGRRRKDQHLGPAAAISQDDLVTNSHPLDPLSAGEIRQTAAIVRRDRAIGDTWRFASIELKEPAKADLQALEAEATREALVVCWDRADEIGRAHV